MSTLHRRIVTGNDMGDYHPHGTGATPMVMPLAHITYERDRLLYGTMHPLVTADGAVIPAHSHAQMHGHHAETIPAGRA